MTLGLDVRFVGLGVLVGTIVFVAVFASVIVPFDPLATNYDSALLGPSAEHLLGCDNFGRDIFSRIVYGAQISVSMALLAVLITAIIGTIVGTIAGFFGGPLDSVLMRTADTFLAFPEIVLGVAIVGVLGPSMANAVIAVTAVMWVRFARIARGLVLSLKHSDFIFTARMSGCGWFRIIVSHLIPHILPQMFAAMLLEIGHIMLILASFSFLGLGVQPPLPEWGAMLNDGRNYFQTAPHMMFFPGLSIFITVAVFNLFGNAVNDRLVNPLKISKKGK
jgi:ABC-type dipeptide/oligopeptide/nickel transport system permease subunit